MHDLLRDYAREQAAARDGAAAEQAAASRLLDYYACAAGAAVHALRPAARHRRPHLAEPATPVPVFGTETAALAWLDAEWESLIAVLGRAAEDGWPRTAIDLATTLSGYLDSAGVRLSYAARLASMSVMCSPARDLTAVG
jgi:hypothetical protein